MTRVLSYNILVGGTHRLEQLQQLIKAQHPDIVGLVEAIDEQIIREIATSLGMEYHLSGRAADQEGWQGALLTRLPVLHTTIHPSTIITKQPLIEIGVQEPGGECLAVFLTHLTAEFGRSRFAYRKRRQEIQELLRIMQARRGTKHLLMGDFNSIAPGEHLKGSSFLRYVSDPHLYDQLSADPSIRRPDLDFVLPPSLHFVKPLLNSIPKNALLSALFDNLDIFYAPRGGIELLHRSGYVDCFRSLNRDITGFTWPAPLPAGRVDFIFASPEAAASLRAATVITEGNGLHASQASDHLPILAEFGDSARSENLKEKTLPLANAHTNLKEKGPRTRASLL